MNVYLSWLTVLNILLLRFDSICEGSTRTVPRPRNNHRLPLLNSCPMPTLKNGTVRMQRAGRMAYFFCSQGFEIHGPMNIVCQNGRWKQDLPICIKPGCRVPTDRLNGFVMMDEKKDKVMLFCKEGHLSAGSTNAYCDGSQWDRELGQCRPDVRNPKICDFETGNMCEWTQDGENDFPWLRKNGWNSLEKLKFGPKHDHTKGRPLEGYFMVAEGTNTRTTQRTRLWSPFYTSGDSENACFRFFYHMYGSKIGRLRVILKPSEMEFDDSVENPKFILFEKQDSQGNQWNEATFAIEKVATEFQIIFEATGSNGLINDIAIDDVALMNGSDCVKYLKPETVTEETGGILGIQSCAKRCTETQSVRMNGSTTFIEDGAIIEKCDCHQECLDLSTCCPDYQTECLENEPTEADVNTTPVEDVYTEIITNIAVTVSTERTTQKVLNSTIASTSTPASTPTSTPTPVTKTTTHATTSIRPITRTTPKIPMLIIPRIVAITATPSPKTYIGVTVKVTEKITKPTKTTKTTSTPSKPITKSTQTTISVHTKMMILKSSPTTNATLAMLMPSDNSRVASLSTIVAVCIFLTLTFIGWRYFNTNKWNQFNSNRIEFKSNYQAEGTEESLIRSGSFIIDDSFDETPIDDFDIDEHKQCNGIKIDSTSKKMKVGKVRTFRKECDLYSEQRCLTADDEHFDFTLQTTL